MWRKKEKEKVVKKQVRKGQKVKEKEDKKSKKPLKKSSMQSHRSKALGKAKRRKVQRLRRGMWSMPS